MQRQLKKILEDNQIFYKEQVGVEELPLQHFDFGVYEGETLLYFIEVQGEQHREEREIFRDNLAKIKERDERKREYCHTHNIPLYEIIYQKGKLLNLKNNQLNYLIFNHQNQLCFLLVINQIY